MSKLKSIEKQVRDLYKNSKDEFMRTCFFENHVKVVSNYGEEIAKEEKANVEICVLSALFHDVARPLGVWDEPQLMDESLKIAEELMKREGYSKEQIQKVKETIIPHSCTDKFPIALEGKILATADALAHLMTDFYLDIGLNKWIEKAQNPYSYKKWVIEKIDRDFNRKIFFGKWKEESRKRYEAIKIIFTPTKF